MNRRLIREIFLLILVIITFNTTAQNHYVGIQSGVNYSNVDFGVDLESFYKTGFTGGLNYEFVYKNNYLFSADILYNQFGYKMIAGVIDDSLGPITGEENSNFNFNYVSLPIKVGLIVGDRISGFINIGIVTSLLASANAKLILPHKTETIDWKDHVKKIDLAGLVEIGSSIRINNRIFLLTTLSYQRSFSNYLLSEDLHDDTKYVHYSFSVNLGLKYHINR